MRAWRHKRAKYVGRRVSGEEGQQIRPERQVADSAGVGLDSAAHQLCDFSKFTSFLYWAPVRMNCSHAWECHCLKSSRGKRGKSMNKQ